MLLREVLHTNITVKRFIMRFDHAIYMLGHLCVEFQAYHESIQLYMSF